ncbi:DUF3604 domain-containing protein [Halioglobus maricola]|uniref:DUF3604 domain-containing protein n=1 Tax=Halioglobus maricola TaxID=2601894 RepID=A0A5P9NIM6_9GAMM|nr:DUF3604 domain-containing protein [Halioglobus maricola]QFU75376.1 DUF3604 domain-containing protein [Halioglobus maricola]
MNSSGFARFSAIAALVLPSLALAIPPLVLADSYSPYPAQKFPRQVYWGDTHLHTALSGDSISTGNRLMPEDAYRFARGETVTTTTGVQARLSRPLDFVVVADHSEYLGVIADLVSGARTAENEFEKRWLQGIRERKVRELTREYHSYLNTNAPWRPDEKQERSAWERSVYYAEKNNIPGQLTAFIGYEWSTTLGDQHMHRNVIFRDGADRTKKIVPFSSLDSTNPEDLWDFLASYESSTGGRVLAIPHNPNLSIGGAFPSDAKVLTPEYVAKKRRFEPLVEVTQTKGDSETHPVLSADDAFADFERHSVPGPELSVEKERALRKKEYARSALQTGLKAEKRVGENPYGFGMIGSTDSHIAISGVEENSFFGSFTLLEPPMRAKGGPMAARFASTSAAGYAAVWATENTREAIFDAMIRKETYASTGPRMTVRFFAGWEFETAHGVSPDVAAVGYALGVPMGGELHKSVNVAAPSFLVSASKDPLGANLDRIQIIKGWLDADGSTREKVYDVALSDARQVGSDGSGVSPVGSTVDVDSATYTNAIGDSQLATVWRDPDFDASQPAFYYARVLEIPTPRWTTYDTVRLGTDLPKHVPAEIQERAYTSPIWYSTEED